MKLKYYLRGIGIGMIVTTLILMVSGVIHNNNLSDEKIIKEALKLGMVMPESTEEKDSLWVRNTEEESEANEPEEDTTETDTQTPDEESLDEEPTDAVSDNGQREMVEFIIEPTSTATLVSQNLYQAGLVDSAEAFLSHLQENDYTHSIRTGVFYIPQNASYEEICDVIMRRNQ